MKLKINPAFRDLIPKLSNDELKQLEENLIAEGCRDALVIWNETIVDGHNRYEICTRHDIPFVTEDIDLDSEDDAKIWIIKNQFGRRNLNDANRAVLALTLKPLIAAKARENIVEGGRAGGKGFPMLGKASVGVNTEAEIASLAGVSKGTIRKVEKVQREGSPEVNADMLSGKDSINKAFLKTQVENNEVKTCSTCGVQKPASEFASGKNDCRECHAFNRKYQDDPEKLRQVKKLKIDHASIIEKMQTNRSIHEEQAHECNHVLSAYEATINSFRSQMARFVLSPESFNGVEKSSEIFTETQRAKEDIEKIMAYFMEVEQ